MLSFSSHWTFVFFFCFFLVASLKFSSLLLADRIVDVIDYLFRCFGISFVVCFFFFFFFFLVAFFKFASVIPIESPTVINCHFLSYFLLTRTRCSFFFLVAFLEFSSLRLSPAATYHFPLKICRCIDFTYKSFFFTRILLDF
jgi:hypothetical protein